MKVAWVTDQHFGARGDSVPMQQSMKKFYENIFFPTIDRLGITRVLNGGDYMDRRKYVNYATARFVHDTYREPLKRRGIREEGVVGNHDIYFRHSTVVNAAEELYRYDDNITMYSQPVEIDLDGCGILLLPWIAENNRDASMKLIATTKCPVAFGHLELAGFQMYKGLPNAEGLDPKLFDRFHLVGSGHYHHKSTQGPVNYLGAPYPMIWSDYKDPRGFHVFDTKTYELEFVENPYTLFVKVFYDDDGKPHDYIRNLVQSILVHDSPHHDAYVKVIVKSKTQPYWFDLLMDALYKVNAQDVLVVDEILVNDLDLTDTDETQTDVDTLVLMKDYVESLTISCDRDELYTYLRDKYNEAIAASQNARLN